MAQHSRETTDPGRSPATLPEPAATGFPAAHRLLSLDIVLALLALAGGLRVLYLAAPAPALPAEAANVAHAYALGHLTPFTDAGGAGVSPFGWWQLTAYTMVSDAFGRSASALAAVRETMLVAAVLGAVLLWVLARRLGLTRWASAAAVLLVAASPLALGLQRLVVVEHLAAVWLLGALVLITRPGARIRHDAAAAVCLLAAVLTSPLALLFLPAAGWLLVRRAPARAALVAVLLNLGLGIAFGPAAAALRPHLAAASPPSVADWVALDPAWAVLSTVALVAALAVTALRPFAVSGLLLVAALLVPGVPDTAVLALLLPLTPLLFAAVVQALARQRVPVHRGNRARGPGTVLAAGVLVAVVATGWGYGYPALRPAAERGGPLVEAQDWLRANASGARVLVDDGAWAEFAKAGWPTGLLVPVAACASGCPAADWSVFTTGADDLRSRYPALDTALADAGVTAVFGQVTVSRLGLPAADRAAPSEESARTHAGAALAASARITCTPDAVAVLRAGRADPRLIATIAALAALQPVGIAGFPAVPGEDPAGQPRRRVLLTDGEEGAAAFYAGQRDLFRPSSVARTAGGVLVTYPLFAPPGLLVPFSSP
ncbi:glycosyl transferase [Amycolatopsis mediterranei S699]|uniref:Glycosyl transferase family protein n=2 Tax=Amycolatopsis mediterranei TaxID=33910 RepID=A0A0H3D9P5_AMYMU|nr:glycosyl transferase [Amycolatopsis mediterranei]ADJ46783.1 glycosyl transferase family protein [Amycolatopsis mediterranei U32]AEK43587.1 glycosyl transferase [Amycolatopsis mediterranei S699]AFO78494.1 glycosyl transferase [Amycolatopsis mediterranei S699]AGT85622.1 glycosyl transferase [Amycolatopsis mediterranei RB]KDO11314.1 glycosyl transferase [Amycolatopsis mediterranei]